MKATDKAIELYNKLSPIVSETNEYDTHHNKTKRCAIILVDEILSDNPNIYDSDRLNHMYWKEVKLEIQKLVFQL